MPPGADPSDDLAPATGGGPPPAAAATGATTARAHRNWWPWISAALLVVAVGLLVWALDSRSDLSAAQQDNAELQAQADQTQQNGAAAASAAKGAYEDLSTQVGSVSEDLAATEKDLEAAEKTAAQAQDDAAAAKQDAAAATDETAKAQAERDEAEAQAKAAQSKATIATDCAKSYLAAVGSIFDGSDISAQAAAVKKDLESITAQCKSALAGA